jgi:hypothetical protein
MDGRDGDSFTQDKSTKCRNFRWLETVSNLTKKYTHFWVKLEAIMGRQELNKIKNKSEQDTKEKFYVTA